MARSSEHENRMPKNMTGLLTRRFVLLKFVLNVFRAKREIPSEGFVFFDWFFVCDTMVYACVNEYA